MDPRWTKQTALLADILQRVGECLKVPSELAEVHQVLRALEDSTDDPRVGSPLGLLALAGRQLE